jgi:hypothetical protein
VGKDAAWRRWQQRRDRPPLADILDAITRHRASREWQRDGGEFIPHPATWLNQGRWADEVVTGEQRAKARVERMERMLRGEEET